MFMALTLLANYKMSFTPAIYTLIMLFTAGILVKVIHLRLHSTPKEQAVAGLSVEQTKE
jgi:BASS family bile acid:Na+ symporter